MTNELTQKYKKLLDLSNVGSVSISPDGESILYTVDKANWRHNSFISQLYLLNNGFTRTINRTMNVSNIEWIDNESFLILMSDKEAKDAKGKSQLYYHQIGDGDSLQLTSEKFGVNTMKIMDDYIVVKGTDKELQEKEDRKNVIGEIIYDEQEVSTDTLYLAKISELIQFGKDRLFELDDNISNPLVNLVEYIPRRTIENHVVADNELIFGTRPYAELFYIGDNIVYSLQIDFDTLLDRAKKEKENKEENDREDENALIDHKLTELSVPENCSVVDISPDRKQLLCTHSKNNKFYEIADIYTYTLGDDDSWELFLEPERSLLGIKWNEAGIHAMEYYHTTMRLVKLEKGKTELIDTSGVTVFLSYNVNEKGDIVFRGATNETAYEIYQLRDDEMYKLTDFTKDLNIDIPPPETITWKSKDGREIEGVMYKPKNFDPEKTYPLLFQVHGGPSWFNMEVLYEPIDLGYYPTPLFLDRGFIVVKPNYRGSIGRGREFLQLNVGNIGTGDLWDIESCIDHLDELSIVDTTKVGCMGWSQGGFISAFVGTHSKKVHTVSMGAGISSWYTYWQSNDIRQWTNHYLEGTPRDNWEEYIKTAPITKVDETNTPFLIQHGENDQRVPLPNALEMKRRLEDAGVQAELFIFKGMGHGIDKPRPRIAVIHQNYNWFCHQLLGDDLDFFAIIDDIEDNTSD